LSLPGIRQFDSSELLWRARTFINYRGKKMEKMIVININIYNNILFYFFLLKLNLRILGYLGMTVVIHYP
jgi:hypothetical protein